MIADAEPLPDDIELLKKLVLEARQELARSQDANTRLWETLRQLQRAVRAEIGKARSRSVQLCNGGDRAGAGGSAIAG
jgi:hypothetical protein